MSIKTETTSQLVTYGLIAGGGFLLYRAIASGLLRFPGSKAFTGEYGAELGTAIGETEVPAILGPLFVRDYTPTEGAYVMPSGAPGLSWAQVLWGSDVSLDVAKTDAAFAKVGLTTIGYEQLGANVGNAARKQILISLINGDITTLSTEQLAALWAVGWTGETIYRGPEA